MPGHPERGRASARPSRRGALLFLALAACPSSQSPSADDPDSAIVEPFTPPRGATWDPSGTTLHFRLAAPRATRVEVWLYPSPLGAAESARLISERGLSGDWETSISGLPSDAPVYYGYRVWGASWTYDPSWTPGSDAGFVARVTADGDRMNPNKLLVDPYAREVTHDPTTPLAGGTLDTAPYRTDDANRAVDSAPVAPKSIVLPRTETSTTSDLGTRPTRALADDIIYEVHLRGLTAADTSLTCAGTYAGAAARAPDLAALGVTAVEFLPVQETWNDTNDVIPDSSANDNYWGYSTLAYFSPDRRYACDRTPGGPTREWRALVRAFHDAGIKVFIDVVYNHTAEGGGGNLLSLRGIDNATYYELDAAGTGFTDHTGVGANTNVAHTELRDLAIDSLTYWSRDLGVDGFRFDLAPVLANGCERGCYRWAPDDPGNILVRAATELPDTALIAEPWGIGAGTYQVGAFPAGWSEWNDQFRDLVRKDVNLVGVETVTLGGLADRIVGSPGIFRASGRGPSASINYLVSHDGFTLGDVTACDAKSNAQPWPYGPSNGGNDTNFSFAYGGDRARQRQAARTSLALVMLSAGVPMMVGGDEVLRSQRCNNNPYNLDSLATWLDPTAASRESAFHTFTSRLLAFRAAHPSLRRLTWHDASSLAWLGTDGLPLPPQYFNDPGANFLAWRILPPLTLSERSESKGAESARSLLVAYNGSTSTIPFTLPPPAVGAAWYRAADTAAWLEPQSNFAAPGAEYRMNGTRYDVAARSLAIFVEN